MLSHSCLFVCRYYKNNEGSPEWYSNITVSFKEGSDAKTFTGRAIFFVETATTICDEIILYKTDVPSGGDVGVLIKGPNPPPPPAPGPHPGPPGGGACNELYR